MMSIISIPSVILTFLLLCVIISDVTIRLISNKACLAIAAIGMIARSIDPLSLAYSVIVAGLLFLLLLLLHHRGWMGGGDAKLIVALAIALPITQLSQFLIITALLGGGLAVVHLVMRCLPYPALAPAGAPLWRRVYAVERWRNLRHSPLPYGVAIASSGIWIILNHGA